MGLFSKLFTKRAIPSPINAYSLPSVSSFSFGSIYKNPTVIACTNTIANSISILPLNLYFKNPKTGARQKAGWHQLYTLLKRRPNYSESPTLFVTKMVRHILQKGNAYIFKNIVDEKVLSLHMLNPEAVKEKYNGPVVTYMYNNVEYTSDQILHIPSLITDDYGHGVATVDLAKAAVLLGIQLDECSLSSFGNGINTKLLIDIADMLKDVTDINEAQKVAQTVADYVSRTYTGAGNAGKPFIPLNGMKVVELKGQSSNRDAELLESRKWQEAEICKVFGVPQFLIGNYEIKYGGLEQAMMVFLNFSLSPLMRHIEQRLNTLLSAYEQETYYFEFDFNILLRADEKSRAELYTKLFMAGVMSPDDIAAKENLEPDPNGAGAMRFVPANLMPQTLEVQDAYMASAKLKAASLSAGTQPAPTDPALSAGSQAQ